MRSEDLRFDVAGVAGLKTPAQVAATLHLPDRIAAGAALDLMLCLHGGGCTRSYWHPGFGTENEYSFAAFFTARGKAVLAVDHLGMGDSSRPEPESQLSRAAIAAANARALKLTRRSLQDGSRADAARVSVTGVGHSIGGMMVITQAATHHGMDRVAVLGWANQPMTLGDTDVAALTADLVPSGYLPSPRPALRKLFYLADVPATVIAADEASGSLTPSCLGRDALTPGIVHAAAASITVPVLIVHGIVDTSPDPWGEVAFFKGSHDVTLNVADASAHMHNLASARRSHWERLDRWVDSVGR